MIDLLYMFRKNHINPQKYENPILYIFLFFIWKSYSKYRRSCVIHKLASFMLLIFNDKHLFGAYANQSLFFLPFQNTQHLSTIYLQFFTCRKQKQTINYKKTTVIDDLSKTALTYGTVLRI